MRNAALRENARITGYRNLSGRSARTPRRQIEKQILKQIEQLKKDGNVEELLHGRWSHMEALDEDEWLEHLEEHLKEIVNISWKRRENTGNAV